jgi:catechol 2,3-dioxygenase-like lactoylglutathione lyase family enzyme
VPRVRSINSTRRNWVPRTVKLVRTCLIVSDVAKVREFYRAVFQVDPVSDFPEYAEFDLAGGGLALFNLRGQEALAPGSAEPGKNRCSMIEVEVDDVDREFERLGPLVTDWVKPPTTQSWGSRSVYFRDPEGNLVNFFTRAKSSPP